MTRKIITDSGCDLVSMDGVAYERVPFSLDFHDGTVLDVPGLDIGSLVDRFEAPGDTGSACPGPQAWYEAGSGQDEVFMLPITKGMSGSHNAAVAAKSMLEADGTRVCLADTCMASAGLSVMADMVRGMILDNVPFEGIRDALHGCSVHLDFSLKSLKNLVKNGRVPKLAASVAGALGISVLGEARDGVFWKVGKCRGEKQVLASLIGRLEASGFKSGAVYIAHCLNPELAGKLAKAVSDLFSGAVVHVLPASGLCSYYAERGGILIGYAV